VAQQPGAQPDSDQWGWGCGLAILVAVILSTTSLCSKEASQTVNGIGRSDNAVGLMNTSTDEVPPAPQPFSRSAAKVGFRHFRLAYRLEGATGAMIYSRNCYDALERHFSWAKLDTCGAFDMAASEIVTSEDGLSSDEASYFDSEASAGRYLALATKAGEPTPEADARLVLLQRATPKRTSPEQPAVASMDAPAGQTQVPGSESNTVAAMNLENVD
jgi:hypothetical protein